MINCLKSTVVSLTTPKQGTYHNHHQLNQPEISSGVELARSVQKKETNTAPTLLTFKMIEIQYVPGRQMALHSIQRDRKTSANAHIRCKLSMV
jgi:hypothetical protein